MFGAEDTTPLYTKKERSKSKKSRTLKLSSDFNRQNPTTSANDITNYDDDYNQVRHNDDALTDAEFYDKVTLSWHSISCYAPIIDKGFMGRSVNSGRKKQLLYSISGIVEPGQLLAIMGASGAGKSTFLNILNCRNIDDLEVEGTVKANGVELGPNLKYISAYVQQDDMFWENMRVREHLWIHSKLRMGSKSNAACKVRVLEVAKQMGLEECYDQYISVLGKDESISGSEKKLLSIATEILTDPQLLILDEPTTGLDSQMAESVMTYLKKLASMGKTIICTIHQPSSNVFSLFDNVLLLAEGRTVFLGPRKQSLDFFEETGFPCPLNYNPADHFIHTLAIRPGNEVYCQKTIVYMAEKFKKSIYQQQLLDKRPNFDMYNGDANNENIPSESVLRRRRIFKSYKSSWWTQILVITWRHLVLYFRNRTLCFVRVLQNMIYAATIILLFNGQEINQTGIKNLNGAVNDLLITVSTLAIIQLNNFAAELPLFVREHQNGLYRTNVYFLAKNVHDLPLFFISMIVPVIPIYFTVGLRMYAYEFFMTLLVMALVYQFSMSLQTYFIAIVSGSIDIALNVAPPCRLIVWLLGGYFINDATIPVYINWLKYLSWHRYGFEIILVTQWSQIDKIPCTSKFNETFVGPCIASGKELIEFYNFKEENIGFDLIMLAVLAVAIRFLGFLALVYRVRDKHHLKKKISKPPHIKV